MGEAQVLPEFDALWDYDHPADTERRFRAVLPAARAAGDAGYLAELLTQIARTEGLQQRFEDAHATLDEAERLLPRAPARARVRYLLERGRALNSSGQRERALPLFVEAWEAARRAGDDGHAVDAAHMVAIAEAPERQLEWNLRALDLAEASADPRARRWLASLHNNVGWTHYEAGRYGEALVAFERALAERRAQGQEPGVRIARWCVGKGLRALGRLDEALEIQRGLLAEHEALGEPSGYVFEELGECLLALGRADEARGHFAQAFAHLSQDPWLRRDEPDRLERLRALAGA